MNLCNSFITISRFKKKKKRRTKKQTKIFGKKFLDLDIEVNIVKLLLKAFIIHILIIIIH